MRVEALSLGADLEVGRRRRSSVTGVVGRAENLWGRRGNQKSITDMSFAVLLLPSYSGLGRFSESLIAFIQAILPLSYLRRNLPESQSSVFTRRKNFFIALYEGDEGDGRVVGGDVDQRSPSHRLPDYYTPIACKWTITYRWHPSMHIIIYVHKLPIRCHSNLFPFLHLDVRWLEALIRRQKTGRKLRRILYDASSLSPGRRSFLCSSSQSRWGVRRRRRMKWRGWEYSQERVFGLLLENRML